jgi:hypothetical protein
MTIETPFTEPPKLTWLSRLEQICRSRPWTWKLALCIGLGTISIGGTLIVAAIVTTERPTEEIAVPVARRETPERDLTWLADLDYCAPQTGRTITDCLVQIRLWLDYAREIVTGEEALRYRAKASEFMSNPQTPDCFKKPQIVCLGSFAGNINRDLEQSLSLPESARNAAIVGAIAQYQALVDARLGSPQTSPAPSHALILRILEKAESDMAVFMASDPASNTALNNLGDFYEYDSSLPLQPTPRER